MKIAIIGTGHIGKTLVKTLSAAGHDVKVANSRGPQTIEADLLANGAQAATTAEAMEQADVVILSIPLLRLCDVAPLVQKLPAETVVIDTSNYYPMRDGAIEEIEAGEVESLWVAGVLGRPVVKAWNAIGSDSFARKGAAAGSPGRIAIPVAADDDQARAIAMDLVNDTGFDGLDAGGLADSWRQQPGAPGYCTDLTREELGPALSAAQRARLPKRRDLAVAVMQERLGDATTNPDADFGVRITRAINM